MEVLTHAMESRAPLIIGAVADLPSLKADPRDCDLIELRIDSVGTNESILNYAIKCTTPLLITARGPEEGGKNSLTMNERREAYLKLMPYASAIDIELRSHTELADVITEAKKQGTVVVGSFHDFEKTPTLKELESKIGNSADLHKFATFIQSGKDLEILQALLKKDIPLSVMGMGPLGSEARPIMMQLGSILNYGYLGETATAPNQWPVAKLRAARDAS